MRLIDTDVAIDHFHGNKFARALFADILESGDGLYISVVTLTELLAGMRPDEEEFTEKLLGLFTVVDVNNAIARKAGEYLRRYSRSRNLELGDALIAATVATLDAELMTRNVKHYPMDDIRVTVPYERGRK
jgi:hypothetical protein